MHQRRCCTLDAEVYRVALYFLWTEIPVTVSFPAIFSSLTHSLGLLTELGAVLIRDLSHVKTGFPGLLASMSNIQNILLLKH